jgi:hypothetical protein
MTVILSFSGIALLSSLMICYTTVTIFNVLAHLQVLVI